MKSLPSMLATVWRISSPYFRSDDKWAGRILLAAVVVIELATVAISVILNQWRNRFYNALQEHDWDGFVREIIFFTVICSILVAIAVYQLYLNQWLQIRWRKWMTENYLGRWLDSDATHYRMQLKGDQADNPDQRISDDVKLFIDRTLAIGLGLLNSVVTLVSFVVILWGLSETAPFHLFGYEMNIPGYLVWSALLYSIVGTWLTHKIGWRLVPLDFKQQQYEADFRFNLVRVRENSEQIASLKGEGAERQRLLERFGNVISNWYAIMTRTKKLSAFTNSYDQAAQIFPYVLVAPAYFAGRTQLGGMMQAAEAFLSVQGALSFFVSIYRQLADWQAIMNRLDGFETSMAHAAATPADGDVIKVTEAPADAVSLRDLQVQLPDGAPLASSQAFDLRGGERALLSGPSGVGKSTLLRAVTGIWPYGRGSVALPQNGTLMLLPQRAYFPIAPLGDAITYPAPSGTFDKARLREVLGDVGLPALADRLDETQHWNRILSLGEQQRLGIARALLQAPQFLLLDEATASLDEDAEAALYRLLERKLPDTAILSTGHRATLDAFHQRRIELVKHDDVAALTEAQGAAG
ncbi:MAG: ABC transporter ATP-binding protein/permease [Bradyrhizobiaceae bacterium]|nr:MAG: ABC transporter ATP-binding protein/permease [Bradyrhizobiaceae bacterium]